MAQPVLAAQLYTLRDYTRTARELAVTLHRVRAIGYRAVQVSAIGPIAPEELRAILHGEDLAMCNTHTDYERLVAELPAVVAEHRLWDCRHVAIGGMPDQYFAAGEEGYHRFAREANAIGHSLHEAGLTFSYHNHNVEFTRFGARSGLEILLAETDPRYFQAELDTYWVQAGGGDVVQWIRRVKDRMPVVHLKDMVMQGRKQVMAEVGEGNLNWPGILQACREAGVQWYAVEQDICQRDPFESLAISYHNLQAMGLE
jgi:sugar phosphate isomerase/epimerase